MASGGTKTIEEIDDIMEMYPAMMALGISCKGLKTLDEMKAKVKEELNPSVDKPSWTAGQVRILFLKYYIDSKWKMLNAMVSLGIPGEGLETLDAEDES